MAARRARPARRSAYGAARSVAMKGTERGRKRDFALHGAAIRYIIAVLCFIALLHAMATSSSIDARLSRADAFAAEHGPRGRRCAARSTSACWPRSPIGAYDLLAGSSRSAAACRPRPSTAPWISSSSTASSTGSNRRTRSSRAARSACRTKASSDLRLVRRHRRDSRRRPREAVVRERFPRTVSKSTTGRRAERPVRALQAQARATLTQFRAAPAPPLPTGVPCPLP